MVAGVSFRDLNVSDWRKNAANFLSIDRVVVDDQYLMNAVGVGQYNLWVSDGNLLFLYKYSEVFNV